MLATHPSHQHRGAATSLRTELVEEADALGLEIYCEATNTGRPMYEKWDSFLSELCVTTRPIMVCRD